MRTLPAVVGQLRRRISRRTQGQASVVALLLQRGADPTLRDSRYQSTPIGWLQHARGPRRGLTREVAALLEGRG